LRLPWGDWTARLSKASRSRPGQARRKDAQVVEAAKSRSRRPRACPAEFIASGSLWTAPGCILLAVTHTAAAQSFPSRPLTLVVPFAAGGPSDVAGRIVAQGLSEKLGQQVVVENAAGAGGTLGSLRVAKAPPDGYQFVIGNSGTHAWSQALYKKPPYNTATDFAALGLVLEAPRAIITPKNFPANTLPEFIAYVKAKSPSLRKSRPSAPQAQRAGSREPIEKGLSEGPAQATQGRARGSRAFISVQWSMNVRHE
jgi:hypothetical protein